MSQIDLSNLETAENPDTKAEVYGELLNGNGVKIRLSNIEYVDEHVISHWKSVLKRQGFKSTVEHDMSSGYVTINCRRGEKISLTSVGILIVGIIIILRYALIM
jgi:hypothetical protein